MAIPYVGYEPRSRGPAYRCWDPESGDEEDGDDVHAWSPDDAAETFAEDRWSDMDHPEEQTICVRDAEGKVERFAVYAQPTVTFAARQITDAECRRQLLGETAVADVVDGLLEEEA